MPQFYKNHILLRQQTTIYPYTSISQGRSPVKPRGDLARDVHGKQMRSEFNAAIASFEISATPKVDFVYIVFRSAPGFLLDLDKFEDQQKNFRLASYKRVSDGDDETTTIYEATVYLNRKAIGIFLRKVEEYINKNTFTGNPKHQSLIANLDAIRVVTLESFWQEPELPFPNQDEKTWWEIWVDRDSDQEPQTQLNFLFESLKKSNILIGKNRWLAFPENLVFLVKAVDSADIDQVIPGQTDHQ